MINRGTYDDPDGLQFAIEMWTRDDHIDRVIARSSSIVVARAALDAALMEYPGARITLRQGTRVVDGSEIRARK